MLPLSRRGHPARDVVAQMRQPQLARRLVDSHCAGIVVDSENILAWGKPFGRFFVNALKRRLSRSGDRWSLDEVLVRIQESCVIFGTWWIKTGMCWTPSTEQGKRGSSQALVPQVAEGFAIRSASDRHWQVAQLRCRQRRDHTRRWTPTKSLLKRPDRGFALADAPTRTPDVSV